MAPLTAVARAVRSARDSPHRAVVIDAVVVFGLLIPSLGHDTFDPRGPHGGWSLVFDLLLALPLAFRRRWPLETFLVISAVAFGQWVSDLPVGADFAVLLALYAVGAHGRRVWRVAIAVVIAETGAVLAVLRWTPSGSRLPAFIFLTGTVTAACVLGVYIRTRRAYIASVLERAATAERDRDQQAMLATATERARISREMHDIVAHSLSVMIALSDGAAAAIERSPAAAEEAMVNASTLGRQALGEVRRLLGSLHETADVELTPAPGIAQLEELAARVRSAGLLVDLVIMGEPLALPPAAQLTVYRMVQEALTNVLKHAKAATLVTVTLRYTATRLDIEIENDDHPALTTTPALNSAQLNSAGLSPAELNPAELNSAGLSPAGLSPAGLNRAGLNRTGLNRAGPSPAEPNRAEPNRAEPNRAGPNRAGTGPAGPGPVGHGLAGMRERAAVFAGTVEAGRRADGGWRVASCLRLDERVRSS
jgi:signal transduction histidine kinase